MCYLLPKQWYYYGSRHLKKYAPHTLNFLFFAFKNLQVLFYEVCQALWKKSVLSKVQVMCMKTD